MSEENENVELICPITLEIFRDPVKAKDGQTYEREAIQRWILEHGTSPITRQPLQINELLRDDHLREIRITPEIVQTSPLNIDTTNWSNEILIFIILFSFLFPICFILEIYFALKSSYTEDIDVTSRYSDMLTTNNSYFNQTGTSSSIYYYKTFQLNISMEGFYGFEIVRGSVTSINANLYRNNLNSTDLNYNLISYSYKDKTYSKTYFGQCLSLKKYILMITTYFCCSQRPFSLLITEPEYVI